MTLAAPVPLWPSELIGESFRLRKFTNVARSSPKQPSDNPVRIFEKHIHRPHNGDGAASVSPKESSETMSERAKRALERRLRPHTTLSAYELAYALRISESTIWAILGGNSKTGPSGRVLQLLVEFFGGAFLQEIFGGPNVVVIDPSDARKADALRRMIEAQDELRRLG